MGKLTSKQVESLRATDKPIRIEIDSGLQLRIATNGTKTWVVRYRVNGERRDYRLPKQYAVTSDGGHMSLADARIEAAKIRAMARNGINVQVSLKEERERRQAAAAEAEQRKAAEHRENLTVANLFDAWLARGVRRLDNNAGLRRSFNPDVLPTIGAQPIRTLAEHDLRAVMRAIVARGANRTAVMT